MGACFAKGIKPIVAASFLLAGAVFAPRPALSEPRGRSGPAVKEKSRKKTKTIHAEAGDALWGFPASGGSDHVARVGTIDRRGITVVIESRIAGSKGSQSQPVHIAYGRSYTLGEFSLTVSFAPRMGDGSTYATVDVTVHETDGKRPGPAHAAPFGTPQ